MSRAARAARAGATAPGVPRAAALRDDVQRYYTERLEGARGCCAPAGSESGAEDVAGEVAPSFGCGHPTAFAELRAGETVLDLGSGAGLDVFRAAEAVGPEGRAIGVDMTPAMLARARQGAARLGAANVRFVEGFIEAVPLEDESVDVVLSNCVINLSQDKPAVFREAHRVLRKGGRLAVSDVLRNGSRAGEGTVEGWCACVDGAEPAESYRAGLLRAGFVDVAIDPVPPNTPPGGTYNAGVRAVKPAVRKAAAADMPGVRALLERAGLPTAGLAAVGSPTGDLGAPRLHVWVVGGPEPVAVVGLEHVGASVLLRSLAVREDARHRGYGHALLRHALASAAGLGAATAYGLTTTIPDLLVAWGFEEIPREELPGALLSSEELRGACPASARAFRLALR